MRSMEPHATAGGRDCNPIGLNIVGSTPSWHTRKQRLALPQLPTCVPAGAHRLQGAATLQQRSNESQRYSLPSTHLLAQDAGGDHQELRLEVADLAGVQALGDGQEAAGASRGRRGGRAGVETAVRREAGGQVRTHCCADERP